MYVPVVHIHNFKSIYNMIFKNLKTNYKSEKHANIIKLYTNR